MQYIAVFFVFAIAIVIISGVLKYFKSNKNDNIDDYKNSEIFKEAYNLIINNSELVNLQNKLRRYKYLWLVFFLIIIPWLFIPILLLGLFGYFKNYNKYKNVYKEVIVGEILKKYYPDLVYNHFQGMDEYDYGYANFENYDIYESEDLIKGKINDIPFILADVVTKRVTTDSDGNRQTTILFSGAVAKLKLPESINSYIYILNNTLNILKNSNYITIDNEQFEKIFDVLSDNEILAMRLLTPSVTNAILDLEVKTNIHFELKLYNDDLYFRFYTNDLFEPKVDALASAVCTCKYLTILTGINEIMNLILKTIREVDL